MPLTTAMARFVDVSELIRSRAEVDDVLRDLCEDYQLARQLLLREKKQRPRHAKRVAEYASLVDELEDEIMQYLIGAEQRPTQK